MLRINKSLVIFLLIFILVIPVVLPLTKPGFFPTQDYIYVARIYQMDKSLKDGQFPVRWVPDFRYGEPLYNFYAPLTYYVGSLVKTFGFSYLDTTKILYGLGFLLSTLAMFFLGKELFGNLGGLLSATLYLYAPYHSVDVYVRGAISESWSLIFFPLIFLFSQRLVKNRTKWNLIFLSLALAGLFFTHNIMTVLFLPFFFTWVIFLIWRTKILSVTKYLIFAIILGFGLAASFLLPAFFEKGFVQSKYLLTGYFDFRGHFVAIPQFFSTFWGYGASLWGPHDDMSFQVGVVHWAVLLITLILTFLFRRDKKLLYLNLFLTLIFLFSLFMQHNKSAPIWEAFSSILAYTQFPWRFLGVSIFFVSLIGGSLNAYLQKQWRVLTFIVILSAIFFNVGYFHPESYYLDSKDEHYISDKILSQDDKLPRDYLPIWVLEIGKEKLTLPVAKSGKIEVLRFDKRSASAKFNVLVQEDSTIEVPITYFPGWQVTSDGKPVNLEKPSNLGLIVFKLPPGPHLINLKFADTPQRGWGNIISLISFIVLGWIIFSKKLRLNE